MRTLLPYLVAFYLAVGTYRYVVTDEFARAAALYALACLLILIDMQVMRPRWPRA